jgi:hypothetical protein
VIRDHFNIYSEDETEEETEADNHVKNEATKKNDSTSHQQEAAEAPKPVFFNHITISRDFTGTNDEVASKLLSALAERSNRNAFAAFAERSKEDRFAAFADKDTRSVTAGMDNGSRATKKREDRFGTVGRHSEPQKRSDQNKLAAISRESRFMNADLTLLAKKH